MIINIAIIKIPFTNFGKEKKKRRRKEMTQSVFHFKLYNSLLRELCHSATINNRTGALSRIPHSRISKRIRRGRKNIKVYIRFIQNFRIPRRNLLHWQQPRCTISLYHPPRIISIRVIMTRKEMEEEGRRGGSERNKRSNRACGIISAGRFRAVEAGLSPYR